MRLELKERSKTESAVEIECLGCIFGFVQPTGEFLNWEKALPSAPTFRIGVNAEYLLSALQAAKASVGGTFKQPAILEFRGPIAPHYDQDQPRGRQNGPAGAHQGGGQWL